MLSKVFLVLPVVVVGVAATTPDCVPEEVCVDGVNECDVPWGGCYNVCDPDAAPSPPPCDKTTAAPTPPSPTTDPEDDCSTRTVCWDGVNDCGMMYGGCFPDCQPWPTFEPPPCPSSSTWKTVTTTASARPECEEEGEHTICVDKVNECGMKFGGCYDYCATPTPEFETPACSSGPSPTEPSETNCAETTICVDYINDCGMMYGGCHSVCSPTPSYTAPPCPSATETKDSCSK